MGEFDLFSIGEKLARCLSRQQSTDSVRCEISWEITKE